MSPGEQPQAYALFRGATGIGVRSYYRYVMCIMKHKEALGYLCEQ